MPRPEIVAHLLKIRPYGEDYYQWAVVRYERLFMPGLAEEVEQAWMSLPADDRLPPWERKTKLPPIAGAQGGSSSMGGE